jgi:3-oxoacyl-(acyl-carrier-protein) synthase
MEIVISQIGVVSAWGRGLESFQMGLQGEKLVLQESEELQYLPRSVAGLAPNKGFRQYLKRRKAAKLMTDSARLAMDACGQIIEKYEEETESIGLFFAVGREPSDEGEAEDTLVASVKDGMFSEEKLAEKGQRLYPPLLPLKTLPNMILGHLSIHFNLCGENGAWAGEGWRAFDEGFWAVAEGRATQVLIGAADSLVDLGQARDLHRIGITNPPGQGACAFLLESKKDAEKAGRKIWATLFRKEFSADMEQMEETLEKWIGHCGVCMPMFELLGGLLKEQEEFSWGNFHLVLGKR